MLTFVSVGSLDMVQRSAPSDLICIGIHTVNLIFGYVINVKFRKILLRNLENEVPFHVATARWK